MEQRGGRACCRAVWLCGAVLWGVLLVAATSLAGTAPVRVGATVSLEGKYAPLSLMVKRGYELWADEVNRRGGLLGRPVELLFYDDKSRANLVGLLYEKMIIEDEVDLVLAPYGSPLTRIASEVTEKHQMVLLAGADTAPALWDRGYTHLFETHGGTKRQFIGFLDLMAREGMDSLAVLCEKTPLQDATLAGIRTWAAIFGLELTLVDTFFDIGMEASHLIKQLQASQSDGLIICGEPAAAHLFLELMEQARYRPSALALTITPSLADFSRLRGEGAEGIFSPSPWEPADPEPAAGLGRFLRKFEAVTGTEPAYQAIAAFASCQLLEKTIRKVRSLDHAAMRRFLASQQLTTLFGSYEVDERGRQRGSRSLLIQWQNGRKEIVYPSPKRTAPPLFETP